MKTPPIPPEYIRLPKPKTRCEHTGLSRSTLYELIVPRRRNNFRPPVKSKQVKGAGAMRGIRLIHYPSLLHYLHHCED